MKIPDMILQARKKKRKGERKRKGKEKEKLVRWIVSRMAGIIWSFTQSIKNESEVAAVIEDQFYTVYSGISILNHGRRKRECGYKATKVAHKKNICICKKYIYICICKKRKSEKKKGKKREEMTMMACNSCAMFLNRAIVESKVTKQPTNNLIRHNRRICIPRPLWCAWLKYIQWNL